MGTLIQLYKVKLILFYVLKHFWLFGKTKHMPLHKKGDKRLLRAWASYDWANSVYFLVISSAIFPLYYGYICADETYLVVFGMSFKNTALYIVYHLDFCQNPHAGKRAASSPSRLSRSQTDTQHRSCSAGGCAPPRGTSIHWRSSRPGWRRRWRTRAWWISARTASGCGGARRWPTSIPTRRSRAGRRHSGARPAPPLQWSPA